MTTPALPASILIASALLASLWAGLDTGRPSHCPEAHKTRLSAAQAAGKGCPE